MKRIALFSLLIASLACNAPLAASPTPPSTAAAAAASPTDTPTAAPAPTDAPLLTRSDTVAAAVAAVDMGRLLADVEALAAIPTRHVNSPGTVQAAETIYAGFEAAGVEVSYQNFPMTFEEEFTNQRNVIGRIAGSGPESIVLVAHYDSRTVDYTDSQGRAPGANDNATGVAALLEMARLLHAAEPRRSIVLIAAAAEEVGRVGSRTSAAQSVESGDIIPLMIALDTIGNAQGAAGEGAVRVFSPPPSRWAAHHAGLMAEAYTPGFEVLVQDSIDRPNRYGDHFSYVDQGYTAIRYIEAVEDLGNNHSTGDTPDRLSPGYLQQATRLILAQTLTLANAPEAPSGLRLEGDSLRWNPVDGAQGYLVAVRTGNRVTFTTVTAETSITRQAGDAVSVAAFGPDGTLSLFAPEVAW